jgi:hypothetical protein
MRFESLKVLLKGAESRERQARTPQIGQFAKEQGEKTDRQVGITKRGR